MTNLAEYPGALWLPAHPRNYTAAERDVAADVDRIVHHGTSGRAYARAVTEMWQQPPEPPAKHGTSAHFVVGLDGDARHPPDPASPAGGVVVYQTVLLKDVAQHAHDANGRSVGVEICMREPNEPSFPRGDPGLPPTPAIYAAVAKLSAWLCWRARKLPTRTVLVGHAEVDAKTTHRGCPESCGFQWSVFMPLVSAEFAAIANAAAI